MATPGRHVAFVPGGVTPVAPSYAALLAELGDEIAPVLKELELYASSAPPAEYSIGLEVEALRRTADAAGLGAFHLVGYSGGAAISLAFAARYPERLRSLALFEPANVPGAWEDDEREDWRPFRELSGLPPDRMLAEFTRLHLRPGVPAPGRQPGPEPEWMASRPAGLAALMHAFSTDDTDRARFAACRFPVYLGYGLLTAEFMVERVRLLAGLLPDIWIEAYAGVHHFAPPQRTQPARFANALRHLWARADTRSDVADATTPPRPG